MAISLSNKDNLAMYYYSEDLNGNRIIPFRKYEQSFEIDNSQKIFEIYSRISGIKFFLLPKFNLSGNNASG